jgi:hypothetical protein
MGFRDVFKKKHTLLPVIHVRDEQQAYENVAIACENGADGVFLIGHGMFYLDLLLIQQKSKERFPGCWIGVNCLDLPTRDVWKQVTNLVDGVWTDNAEIQEADDDQPSAREIVAAKASANYRGLYFGGVAFKFQRHVTDLSRGAALAKDYVDVVTTSGIGTGRSPDVEKIKTMKGAIGDHPLAIASGITPGNVSDYKDADVFMVATGISKTFHDLDADLVKALADALR